jgi:hypothetical protein
MNELLIEDSNHKVRLEFAPVDTNRYTVRVASSGIKAEVDVSASGIKALPRLLADAAIELRGWAGTREWKSADGELWLGLTYDPSGQVIIGAVLDRRYYDGTNWRLVVDIVMDHDELGKLAQDASRFAMQLHDAAPAKAGS